MIVFIDTNIYLRLFHPPGDEKDYIGKLNKLMKDGKFQIFFPQIVRNEIYRNIDKYPKDTKKTVSKIKPTEVDIPDLFDDEEQEAIKNAQKTLIEKIEEAKNSFYERRELAISKMMKSLFGEFGKLAIDYKETNEQTQRAFFRKQKGYPPGKQNRIGDELAWEILLENFNNNELIIISADKDWVGREEEKLHPHLKEEWKNASSKDIKFYTSLSEFLIDNGYERKITKENVEEEKQRPTLESFYVKPLSPSPSASLPSLNIVPIDGFEPFGSISPSGSITQYDENRMNDYLGTQQSFRIARSCPICSYSWIGYQGSERCPRCHNVV